MFNLWIYYYTFLIVIHSFRHFIIINNLMINRVVRHKFSVRWWRWPMLVENVSHLFGPVFLTKCAQDERSVSDMQSSCAYTSSCCMLPHSHAHSLSLFLYAADTASRLCFTWRHRCLFAVLCIKIYEIIFCQRYCWRLHCNQKLLCT